MTFRATRQSTVYFTLRTVVQLQRHEPLIHQVSRELSTVPSLRGASLTLLIRDAKINSSTL
jgi:hypothetical protein